MGSEEEIPKTPVPLEIRGEDALPLLMGFYSWVLGPSLCRDQSQAHHGRPWMKPIPSWVDTRRFGGHVILLSVELPYSLTMSNPEEAPLGPES